MGKSQRKMLDVGPRLFGIYRGEITSGYGDYRPNVPYQKVHAGWDVVAPTGTNIRAIGNGQVIRVRDFGSVRGYHQEISVFYREALAYVLYGHVLKGIAFEAGDRFKAGEVLAKVGTSEDAMWTTPHAHIQCWKVRNELLVYNNDSAIDPARVRNFYGKF